MSYSYTPNYAFDGDSYDNTYETYSSGDSVYDTFGVDEVSISSTFLTIYFKDNSSMTSWRNSNRSIAIDYASGNPAWEDTFELTQSTEYSVNSTFHYIHYAWTTLGLTSAQKDDMADVVASAGTNTSVIDLTLS